MKNIHKVVAIGMLATVLISFTSMASSIIKLIDLNTKADGPVKKVERVFREYVINEMTEQTLSGLLVTTALITPEDALEITIDSPGGIYYPTVAVISNIMHRDLNVSCRVGNTAYSAAAILLLSCDQATIPDDAEIMFHLPYAVDNGIKLHDPRVTEENIALVKTLGLDKILAEEQWKSYITGGDVFLTGKAFKLQLKNR